MKWQEELRKNLKEKPYIQIAKLKKSVSWFKKNLKLLPMFEALSPEAKKVIKADTEEIIKRLEEQIKVLKERC